MQLQDTFKNPSDQAIPWWKGLSFDFQEVRASIGERPMGFRFSKSIIDIEAKLDGIAIHSCGEADTTDLAMTKAIMELVERAHLMKWFRERKIVSTSNGWAAHTSISEAKINAILELVERDAVLAQWYSSTPFIEIAPDTWPDDIRTWEQSELIHSEFPVLKLLLSTEGIGPSVTCLFLNRDGRGVSGHGTKSTLKESIDAAIAETCRAAHHAVRRSCWKDTLTLLNRQSGRVDPSAHAVYYAYHEVFPSWMFGKAISWFEAEEVWSQLTEQLKRHWSHFTFEVVARDPFCVGFATHHKALELTWGTTDFDKVFKQIKARRPWILTAERNLNSQPHIVS